MVITSAGDGPVVIDGTLPIVGPWSASGGGLFTAPSGGHEFLQLFIDGELQVLARYPNAAWSDKSVFFAVANWLRSKAPGVHDLTTGEGLLRDQGMLTESMRKVRACMRRPLPQIPSPALHNASTLSRSTLSTYSLNNTYVHVLASLLLFSCFALATLLLRYCITSLLLRYCIAFLSLLSCFAKGRASRAIRRGPATTTTWHTVGSTQPAP